MGKRTTTVDISRKLGVATSTVVRALNGSAGVGAETRKMIQDMAREMDYQSNRSAKSLSRKTIKIGFIQPEQLSVYHDEIQKGIKSAHSEIADFNVALTCCVSTSDSNKYRRNLIKALNDMADDGYSGFIIIPSKDHSGLYECIDKLADRGIAVAIVSGDMPFSRRAFCVCLDGKVAGRIASELLCWFTGGAQTAIFTGHEHMKGNIVEIIDGFQETNVTNGLREAYIYDNYDDFDLAYLNTGKLFREHPEVKGIYIGSANTIPVCRRLEELGLAGEVKVVASDCYPELAQLIRERVVHASIFQDPFRQGRIAMKEMFRCIDEGIKPGEQFLTVQPTIILRSNLESFIS